MKLIRKLSLEEFKTLDNIKEQFKAFVAGKLSKQGKPTHHMNVIDVPGVSSVDDVIYKKKDKL